MKNEKKKSKDGMIGMEQAEYQFRVYHEPVPQPRQRHRVVRKRTGEVFASNYLPKDAKIHAFKQAVRDAIGKFGEPLVGPLALRLCFYMKRPQNHYRTNGSLKDWAPLYKVTKPDGDNLCKGVCDAMNGLAWKDDSQVVDLHVLKQFATDTRDVGVDIYLSTCRLYDGLAAASSVVFQELVLPSWPLALSS